MIFIAGARALSGKRILELFKKYSEKDDIVWGVYKEEFINEFEGQPQFSTLKKETLEKFRQLIADRNPKLANKLTIFEYSQNEEVEVLRKLKPEKAIFINGSWKIAFHRRPIYEFLSNEKIEFSLKSPFIDENEAKEYSEKIELEVGEFVEKLTKEFRIRNDTNFLELADIISKKSFDYTWQTGAVLVKNNEIIITGHNRVLPFEAYIFDHGSLKEHGLGKFSKAHINDLNVNDTLHAEMDIISQSLNHNIEIENSTLYVNLMPCPNCARMIATTGISKIVCRKEHFGGFAKKLFEARGIEVEILD